MSRDAATRIQTVGILLARRACSPLHHSSLHYTTSYPVLRNSTRRLPLASLPASCYPSASTCRTPASLTAPSTTHTNKRAEIACKICCHWDSDRWSPACKTGMRTTTPQQLTLHKSYCDWLDWIAIIAIAHSEDIIAIAHSEDIIAIAHSEENIRPDS